MRHVSMFKFIITIESFQMD